MWNWRATRMHERPTGRMHGSTLYQIAEFHTLSSLLFAYFQGHHGTFAQLPRLRWAEARRRFLLTSVDLRHREPVFDSPVSVRLTLDDVVDKYRAHRLVFASGRVEVADGAHQAVLRGCLNFRDGLTGTGTSG